MADLNKLRAALPPGLPAGIAAIMGNYFDRDPLTFNTDWAGTMPMWGLMMWARRGVPGCLDYVKRWFEAHLQRDPKLTVEQFYATYTGHKSRYVRGRHLPFTTYAGLYGLAYPCAELYRQTGDQRAKEVCLDVADVILHQARRNRFGHVAHDDHWPYDIPDVCFFATEPLMQAAMVAPDAAWVYRKQAAFQLRAYVDVFLNRQKGLSRTIIGPDGPGKTYWSRAQGWLMWSFIAVMRGLEADHPDMAGFRSDLQLFADGIARAVDADGALHAFADEPQSDQETTGTAMCAIGLHESMRRGWLDRSRYADVTERMWKFCARHVTENGGFEKVYYEWALPAELHVESSKTVQFGPHIGALLWLADEMTQPL